MAQSLRTFIGVAIPCSAPLRAVLAACGDFGRTVRPVAADNIHVTLRFLGPTPAEKVVEISEVLTGSMRQIESFSSEIHGLGAFPNVRRPSVLWAGFRDPAPWVRVADAIERPMRQLGIPADRLRFHPHVTLARVRGRPPAELGTWLEQQAETGLGDVHVRTVTLFQSDLTPAGPRYSTLATAGMSDTV